MDAKLFDELYEIIHVIAKKTSPRTGIIDADDVTQEAAMRVLKALAEGRLSRANEARLHGYAQKAVQHATIDLYRLTTAQKRGGEFDIVRLAGEPKDTGLSTEDKASLAEAKLALEVKISALPDKEREMAEMKFTKGLTVSEIAKSLGKPFSTVQSALSSVISTLEDELEHYIF